MVIVGSGAGGGTLGAELAMKGVKTVILEAGGCHEIQDFNNDEWGMFGQISWLDKRTTSGNWRVAKPLPDCRPGWSKRWAYRVGGRWTLGALFSLSLEGEREERANGEADNGVLLKGGLRFSQGGCAHHNAGRFDLWFWWSLPCLLIVSHLNGIRTAA